jgi:hypothetical protein
MKTNNRKPTRLQADDVALVFVLEHGSRNLCFLRNDQGPDGNRLYWDDGEDKRYIRDEVEWRATVKIIQEVTGLMIELTHLDDVAVNETEVPIAELQSLYQRATLRTYKLVDHSPR